MFGAVHYKFPNFFSYALLLIFSALVSTTSISNAQTSNNVELIGSLDPATVKNYGDIWGYVDPVTDKEYALLCARFEGLYVVDVSNPDTPTVASFVPVPPGSNDAKDVKTYQNYAYVVHQTGPLQIIDLSNPENPTDTTFTNQTLANGLHNIFIDNKGFAYIALNVAVPNIGEMAIFDLVNPREPVETAVYVHPNGSDIDVESHDVYVRNDTAFIAYLGGNGGLAILDVTDRSNPQQLAVVNYPGNVTHNVWTTEDGKYALTTDETTDGHLRVFDLSNLGNIEQVGEYASSQGISIHNVIVKGDYAHISYYVDGYRIVDMTDPTQPAEVGFYDTLPGDDQTLFDGAWGAYPFAPSGNIYVSDLSTGLYILKFEEGIRAGNIEGTVTDAQSGQPIPEVQMTFLEANKTVTTDENGGYSFRSNEGTHDIVLSKIGFFTDTVAVEIVAGTSNGQDISLNPNLVAIDISVSELNFVLAPDVTDSTEIIITNSGGAGSMLEYMIDDINGPIMSAISEKVQPTN